MGLFDEDGWFIKQTINKKIEHEENHNRLYKRVKAVPEFDKSKYTIHGHTTHKDMVEGNLKIVPLYETNYKGKKFSEWNKMDSGALALVGKSVKSNKKTVVKILIPKNKK